MSVFIICILMLLSVFICAIANGNSVAKQSLATFSNSLSAAMGNEVDWPIAPDLPLPSNPFTVKELGRVFDYMAVNDLDELTVTYSVPYKNEYEYILTNAIEDVCGNYFYLRPDYYCYPWDVQCRISFTGHFFDLVLSMGALASSLGCRHKRSESFLMAASLVDGLYKGGQLHAGMSEKVRAKVMLNKLAGMAKYNQDGSKLCHSPWTVFTKGYGVCDAFTGAYNMMLHHDGIACHGQMGTVNNGTLHEWTVAILDGVSYNIDVARYIHSNRLSRHRYFAVPDRNFS